MQHSTKLSPGYCDRLINESLKSHKKFNNNYYIIAPTTITIISCIRNRPNYHIRAPPPLLTCFLCDLRSWFSSLSISRDLYRCSSSSGVTRSRSRYPNRSLQHFEHENRPDQVLRRRGRFWDEGRSGLVVVVQGDVAVVPVPVAVDKGAIMAPEAAPPKELLILLLLLVLMKSVGNGDKGGTRID